MKRDAEWGHGFQIDDTHGWKFNGDINKPTFIPSLRLSINDDPNDKNKMRTVCHLTITDGKIFYHNDNPHEYVNKTVNMVDFPENYQT